MAFPAPNPLWLIPALLVAAGLVVRRLLRARNMQYWFGSWLSWQWRRSFSHRPGVRHVYFCFVDHYEPYGGTTDRALAHARVDRWIAGYLAAVRGHIDSDGRPPKHSYFYPAEEYDPALIDRVKTLCDQGYGDVEVHLHHDNDTPENFRTTISGFARTLHERHGCLRRNPQTGLIDYAFIHGNWALDNSRPDGRWCGVDNELDILVETGCYADMTMPSAPSDTQTRKINAIYCARGRAGCRKSHDTGRDVAVGSWVKPGELLLVQGPLTLNWRDARFGVIPKIESAELSFDAPPSAHRVKLWGNCRISVKGAEEHVFIKVHTHGATERSMQMLFDQGGFARLWTEVERQYRRNPDCHLHYVTAREMVEKIHSLACG